MNMRSFFFLSIYLFLAASGLCCASKISWLRSWGAKDRSLEVCGILVSQPGIEPLIFRIGRQTLNP